MKKVKFMTKLATVWLVGLFTAGLINLGSVFAHPISEWSIWAIAAQVDPQRDLFVLENML